MKNSPALLTIDVQKGFHDAVWGKRNNPDCERNIEKLLVIWRQAKLPVIHIQHSSLEPASPLRPSEEGFQFMEFLRPEDGELIFIKNVNSAFIGTSLEDTLRKLEITELVLTGFVTDHCVSTTCRMAANLGFSCTVVSDATATFERKLPSGQSFPAEVVHEVQLASLSGEFARIATTGSLLPAFQITERK